MTSSDKDTNPAADDRSGRDAAAPADGAAVSPGADGDDDALNQSEIDDLLKIGAPDGAEAIGLGALLDSSCIQHRRLPLLEACFDRLIRALSTSLRRFTSENVEVSLAEVSSVRFGSYTEAIPLPALISVFKAVEWGGCGLITIDSPLMYSVIDVLMGGRRVSTSPAIEGRSFTAIEATVAERLARLILKEMSIAFEPMSKVEFRHERLETNPSLAAIALPASTAVLFKIDVDMDDRGGRIDILIPYATLEPVRTLVGQMFMGEKFGEDAIWQTHWTREMLLTDTELEVTLGEQTLPLSDVMAWEVGATLQLRSRPDDLVTLKCGDTPLLRGRVGRQGDKVAIKVEDWIGQRQGGKKSR